MPQQPQLPTHQQQPQRERERAPDVTLLKVLKVLTTREETLPHSWLGHVPNYACRSERSSTGKNKMLHTEPRSLA